MQFTTLDIKFGALECRIGLVCRAQNESLYLSSNGVDALFTFDNL
jgi:hypothetical protein